jgi:hypothetical protein
VTNFHTRNIVEWIKGNLATPEFMEFKHKQLGFVLYGLEPASELEDFTLSPEIEQQHALIAAYFGLYRAQTTLSQCEYYFRRFPFHGLPVSRDDHLRNVCELYFGSFYTIRSRIKLTLNSLKEVCPNANVNVGGVLRIFDKEFDTELRTRNRINHHGPFEDFGIERISIFGVIGSDKDLTSQSWARQHVSGYRIFCREWSQRARRQARRMQRFVEAVACAILKHASFLELP